MVEAAKITVGDTKTMVGEANTMVEGAKTIVGDTKTMVEGAKTMVGDTKSMVGNSWKMLSGIKIIFSTTEALVEVPETISCSVFTRIDRGLWMIFRRTPRASVFASLRRTSRRQ